MAALLSAQNLNSVIHSVYKTSQKMLCVPVLCWITLSRFRWRFTLPDVSFELEDQLRA